LHFENVSWLLVLPFASLETSFIHVSTQKHATTCNYHAVYFKRKAEKVKSKILNEAFHWKPFACKNMKLQQNMTAEDWIALQLNHTACTDF
jgi:hypothetical protein